MSVVNAERYESQGYETRIAVYKVGFAGKVLGLGLWDYHAQAQAKIDGKWMWVDRGVSDSPEYSIDGEIYYWRTSDYRAVLKQNGAFN